MALQALSVLCRENGCDAVLLSGDLFDSARIYRDTLDALRRFFADCGAEVFVAAGNHDYLSPGSPYLTEAWPENVHIFPAQEISCVSVERLHLNVYGASFTAPEAPALLEGFRAKADGWTNLMVLHGDATQAASPYNPITPEQLAASGLAYLALGHIHQASGLLRCGSTCYAWPGCAMGRGFDELGEKGAYLVTLTDSDCSLEFLPLGGRSYEILRVPAGDDAAAALDAALPPDAARDIYRVILTGEAARPDLNALYARFAPRVFSLTFRDETTPKRDLWAGAGEDTLRGLALGKLQADYDNAPDDAARRTAALAARMLRAAIEGRDEA